MWSAVVTIPRRLGALATTMTHRCLLQFRRPTRPMGPPIIDVALANGGSCKNERNGEEDDPVDCFPYSGPINSYELSFTA
jgi:hypothetical protein